MSKAVNVISFDVPYPPDYGGIIDVYYKLVWLKQKGVRVVLHCFEYGRKPARELEELCEKVYYYPRKTGVASNLSYLPYNVRSRQSTELEKNLLANNYPILFEVLHTCYLLSDERFKNRIKIFRHSNIEHVYYAHLARSEKSPLKKAYLKVEARKLERFEKVINNADYILAVNEEDTVYFRNNYKTAETLFIPSFHANSEVSLEEIPGDYILYHGNLSVSENYEAANWLIDNVFKKLNYKVVIAGLKPPPFLKEKSDRTENITLIADPNEAQMNRLIRNARVHALFTAQPTGLKLKLLNVLFTGRFIVCNANMLRGTRFTENPKAGLYIADHGEDFVNIINSLMSQKINSELLEQRKALVDFYSNETNVQKIINLL